MKDDLADKALHDKMLRLMDQLQQLDEALEGLDPSAVAQQLKPSDRAELIKEAEACTKWFRELTTLLRGRAARGVDAD
jgi:hypothetical protein